MKKASKARELSRTGLHKLVWSKPMSSAARDLGMSANGLAKICDRVNVPYPSRGFWARQKAGHAPPSTPLPDPAQGGQRIAFSPERSSSRRAQSRLDANARREQLVAAAKMMIVRDGIHLTTMKRLAQETGISETLAHNYFNRDALLTEVARRELSGMEAARQEDIARGADILERAALGTVRYLREASERGAIIQTLLADPAVRKGLRTERRSKGSEAIGKLTDSFEREYGVPQLASKIFGRTLAAVALRAGRLMANGQTDLATADRLVMAMVRSSNVFMTEKWGGKRR